LLGCGYVSGLLTRHGWPLGGTGELITANNGRFFLGDPQPGAFELGVPCVRNGDANGRDLL
jgi:hypothetical protein